jgi:hypothetical protein
MRCPTSLSTSELGHEIEHADDACGRERQCFGTLLG